MQETFGRMIRSLRKARGISQRDLAEKAGIDFTYLSKIENDRMPPPAESTIRAMAEVLQSDADELIRLAGKVPSDLAEYLIREPLAIKFLRSAQGDIKTREDWIKLLRKVDQERADSE
jgi:transcriptional regulator with XRE-family HTH domain